MDVPAHVPQTAVDTHRSGEKARFEQDLKTVADPENGPAAPREIRHAFHHRRETRESSRAQVIAAHRTGWTNPSGICAAGVLAADATLHLTPAAGAGASNP